VDAQALLAAWHTGLGNNVDAVILAPAGDLTIPCGTTVSFTGLAQESHPGAALACVWDFGDGACATGAAATHTYRRTSPDGAPFQVSFSATDGTGAQGSDTRGIRVIPPPPPGERLANGGFENGDAGWRFRAVEIGNSPVEPPLQGTGAAWFAGWFTGTDSLLQQSVRLPAGPGTAQLSFWLHIDTSDSPGQPYDGFAVKVRGSDGVLRILGAWSNLDAATGYQRHTLDLSGYRGQAIELSFVASYHPLGRSTSFVLDNVSLIAP